MFIVELTTTTGKVCESYATYEEARRRVEQYPADSLVGIPLIFQELADGSQRLIREDGKPLQWHRLPDDRPPDPDETPVSLSEENIEDGNPLQWHHLSNDQPPDPDDEPIPFPDDI
jgi:hypothetical protein